MKASYKDLALIAGNIGKLYDEGISLLNILSLIDELPLKKEYKILLKKMQSSIKNGSSLHESFKIGGELIPSFFNSMVDIGEKTGKIVYVLKGLETFYNKRYYIKKRIKSALTYPIALLGGLGVLGIFVLFVFIPNMINIYSSMGQEIPSSYLKIISFKESFLKAPLLTFIKLIITFFIIPYFVIKNFFKDYINKLIEKIPIYNLINEYIAIVLMYVVVNSGINISIGLQYCCNGELKKSLSKSIKKINNDIKSGISLSESMSETKIFSNYTLAHIKLGEESGSLDKRLELLEEEVFKILIERTNKITKLIQPFLILIIGILILIFIIKFLMPLLDIVII